MALMPILAAPLARKGIQLTHVATPEDALRPEVLAHYDALMIYANHKTLTDAQEQALVSFVEGGKGLIALHCASAMFTEAARYIPLVGGEFSTHGTGEFSAEIVAPDHPIMRGIAPFTTWDETYVHKRHNPVDRTVLMERVDEKGREPYTWVRTQGKGRVFYTAFGHDERTWRNPGFQQLVEQATVWAVSDASRQAWQRLKMPAGHVSRRLQRPELREARPGAEVPDAVLARRFDEVHPGAGRVRPAAVRAGARHHQADHVLVRRARAALGHRSDRLPEPGAEWRAWRRPHQDPRGHQRRWPRRQVHRLRRSAEPRHEPGASSRAASSSRRRRTCCCSRTPTATTRRTSARC